MLRDLLEDVERERVLRRLQEQRPARQQRGQREGFRSVGVAQRHGAERAIFRAQPEQPHVVLRPVAERLVSDEHAFRETRSARRELQTADGRVDRGWREPGALHVRHRSRRVHPNDVVEVIRETGLVAAARDDKIASGQCDDALDLGVRRPDIDRRERRTKLRAREDRDEKRGNVVQVRENDVAWAHPDLPQCIRQRFAARKELPVCQLGFVRDDRRMG